MREANPLAAAADLTRHRCVPCRGDTPPLPPDQVTALAAALPRWQVMEGRRLRRTYRFRDFASGLMLVDRIGALAAEEDHHPDLLLAWGRVEVTLWTHVIGGLTENDFIVAAKTEQLAEGAPGRRPDKA